MEKDGYKRLILERLNDSVRMNSNRCERRYARSNRIRNMKWNTNLPCRNSSIIPEKNIFVSKDEEIIEHFNVIRGFCLCEGYNLESLHSALNKHNYCHWYVDKEKSILVFDLIPYFDKLEMTWATQGKTGKVLFPAGVYPPIQMILSRYNRKCIKEEDSKNYIIENEGIIDWKNDNYNSSNSHFYSRLDVEDSYENIDDGVTSTGMINTLDPLSRSDSRFMKLNSSFDEYSELNKTPELFSKIDIASEMLERGEEFLNNENYWKRLENPIFIFKNGVVVAWCNEEVISTSNTHVNSPKNTDERLDDVLTFLSLYSIGSFIGKFSKKCQYIAMLYKYGSYTNNRFYRINRRIISDIINLKTRSAEEKLAASLAIGQSIRLSLFENFIDDCVDNIRYLPLKLAQVGASSIIEEEFKVQVPQVRKRFSELYSYQISVNLVEDFLDIPEIFWHNYKFHSVWSNLQEYLEIPERLQVLNRRIVMMQELLRVITEEYQTAHANRLTWIVIVLLALHCLAFTFRHIFLHNTQLIFDKDFNNK